MISVAEKTSELDRTIDLLESMTDEELQAVQTVAIILIQKKPIERPFQKLSEDQFFAEIDEAIAEADAGYLEDAGSIVTEIATEFGLVIE